MNNRLHNCKNPYQGKSKKVLCCCSAGLLRSPTAAKVLWKEFGYNTRSVGVDTGHALIPIDVVLLKWADEVVVMDLEQEARVQDLCSMNQFSPPPILVLDIADRFEYMHEELQDLILKSYKEVCS